MRHDLLLLGVLAATLSGPPGYAQNAAPAADAPASATPAPATPTPTPTPTPAKPKPKPKPAPKKLAVKPAPAKPQPPAAPTPPPTPSPPPVPMAAPPPPSLPPPVAVPTRSMPAPVPPAVVADAAGEAIAQKEGLRVTFGSGSSDLNPRTDAALRMLVKQAPPGGSVFNIVALAPGTEEDPSTPRRLSLSRALAVRSVLITEGIPSERIYVKALGASPQAIGDGPADRADVTIAAAPAPSTSPIAAPSAANPNSTNGGKTP